MREYAKRPDVVAKRIAKRPEHLAKRRAKYAVDEQLRQQCRAAARDWQRRNPEKRKAQRLRKYGITVEEHAKMLARQGGACAICQRKRRKLCVDHCHRSGRVRGLLCEQCNFGIGLFGDDPATVRRAVSYLRKSHKPTKGARK